MFGMLKQFYYGSAIGRFLLGFPRKLYHVCLFYVISDEMFIRRQFKKAFGCAPNLRDPKTLNEKIQWLKLHDRTPLHTQCADKYAVRQYVTEKIGIEYLVPMLFRTETPADIDQDRMPDVPFILKTTHGSGDCTMVRDKSAINWKKVRRDLGKTLRQNYYYLGKEWPYKHIEPQIIVERLLLDDEGNVPLDYKFHCFHGQPRVIQVDFDRFIDHKRNFYDTEWQILPFTWCVWKEDRPLWPNGRRLESPPCLEQMLCIAEKLATEFLYARIDLYELDGRIFFGEITFHHGSGTELFTPSEWDRRLGDMLTLPHEDSEENTTSGGDCDQ